MALVGDCYGLWDYLPIGPLAFKCGKDAPGKTCKIAVEKRKEGRKSTPIVSDSYALMLHHPSAAREERAPWTS
jgi:hypothetical protein